VSRASTFFDPNRGESNEVGSPSEQHEHVRETGVVALFDGFFLLTSILLAHAFSAFGPAKGSSLSADWIFLK